MSHSTQISTTLPQQVRASLETQCEALANKVWTKCHDSTPTSRILVGIAGIPGVGKSTITSLLVNSLNNLEATQTGHPTSTFAITIAIDGFHYPLSHLQRMSNPSHALHRRGAPFTYDSSSYLTFMQSLVHSNSNSTTTPTLYAPSFSHELKDPVQNDITIPPGSRIILIEGNYCALNREPWCTAANLMDELWLVEADVETVRHRLARRHVESGICGDLDEAYERVRSTDFVNAEEILGNLIEVNEVIRV